MRGYVAGPKLEARDEALAWWKNHVENARFVIPRDEQPRGRGRRLLLAGGYALEVAGGQAWILKTPQRQLDGDLCLRNYWQIVRAILTNYEPAVIERESAVQLYLEDATPPERLRVRQGVSRSKYTLQVCDDLHAQVMPGEVVLDEAKRIALNGAELLVDRPERTLLALPLTSLREHLERIAVWLRALVVSRPAL